MAVVVLLDIQIPEISRASYFDVRIPDPIEQYTATQLISQTDPVEQSGEPSSNENPPTGPEQQRC